MPKVFLAGVGELMTEVAGEVCDGFICHGFTTERYLREVTLPALERGRAKAGKTMEGFEIVGPALRRHRHRRGADGRGGDRHQAADRLLRLHAGLSPVLELHGWGGLQDELNALSKQGKWAEMGELIDDEMLNTFAVVGRARGHRGRAVKRRGHGDVINRISFDAPTAQRSRALEGRVDGAVGPAHFAPQPVAQELEVPPLAGWLCRRARSGS